MTELERFAHFCAMLGYELEPFQRKIVTECFSPRRETLVLIPRANGKSTLLAGLAVWELLKRPNAQIVVGAASREQASVLFDIAREMAAHPEVAPLVEITRREIRTRAGWLKVIAADGPRQHGLIVDLAIVDELHAHRHDELYIALRTALTPPGEGASGVRLGQVHRLHGRPHVRTRRFPARRSVPPVSADAGGARTVVVIGDDDLSEEVATALESAGAGSNTSSTRRRRGSQGDRG